MFGIDWNGDGVIDGYDHVMDLMILDEMEKEEGEDDEEDDDCETMDWD